MRYLLLLPLVSATPLCRDNHEQCFFWAQVGECETAQGFMLATCAAACSHCDIGTADGDDEAEEDPHVRPTLIGQHVISLGQGSAEPIPFPLRHHDPIIALEAGELHLIMLMQSGLVMTFGDDSMGQLGHPRIARATPVTRRQPRPVLWPAPLTQRHARAVSAGRMYSGALLVDGTFVAWGDNTHSQCGVPAEMTPMDSAPLELEALSLIVAVPMKVPFAKPLKAISLGEVHSLVLTTDGEVWAIGDGSFGAACNVTADAAAGDEVFTRCDLGLEEGESVSSIAAGAFHSIVTTSLGRVLTWGDNTHGQLGPGRKRGYVYNMLQEAQAGAASDEDLREEIESAVVIGEMNLPLIHAEGVSALRTRSFHTAALTDQGRLLMWGDNAYGQLGSEPRNTSAVGDSEMALPLGPHQDFFAQSVALGEFHTLAIDNGSRLFSFGLNTRHELHRIPGAQWDSLPSAVSLPLSEGERLELLTAGAHFGAITSSDGHLYIWGEQPLVADTRHRANRDSRVDEAGGGAWGAVGAGAAAAAAA
eukprot:CAMPEP_0174743904 /NCGR_PEP_ID=MMETSP1094-20130205/82823_1 /TAXON_ID=156173 /ORGANISM="Chrysochromulina brevifilum, Strain UTEX LB 985" /LENGTH=532 /DNA_ID=CAMNT_0015948193 /DNA_START=1 /DNA_END=1595 /DNA_ORIENTATION=+